jgi:hypothetical protein
MPGPDPDGVKDDDVDRVVKTLREMSTPDSPLRAATIAMALRVADSPTSPYIRACITEALRRRLAPIASTEQGYFIVQTKEQLDVYLESLIARIKGIRSRMEDVTAAFDKTTPEEPPRLRWEPEPEEIA